MALNLDFRLEFTEENEKSLILRNEVFEFYNSAVEIDYEHYLFSLGYGADLLIVKDWNVCKRIGALDPGNICTFFIEPVLFFNLKSFPFVV